MIRHANLPGLTIFVPAGWLPWLFRQGVRPGQVIYMIEVDRFRTYLKAFLSVPYFGVISER
ncbi:MAG: hypothetical protein EOO88_61025 [Pedobacter sp.]|nr:MAG: hypothetical protein EOO88_61025 [Pedobacter sp.]